MPMTREREQSVAAPRRLQYLPRRKWETINRWRSQYEIESSALQSFIASGNHVRFQYASKADYSPETLKAIDRLAERYKEHVALRFFGHYGEAFDASILRLTPHIQNLSIECDTAENVEQIAYVEAPTSLRLSLINVTQRDVLRYVNMQSLTSLGVGPTKQKNRIDLQYLSQSPKLTSLGICGGNSFNLCSIAKLPSLHQLSLVGFRLHSVIDLVSSIGGLKKLDLLLGSGESLEKLEGKNIEWLSLARIRGLRDLGDIGRFVSLKFLDVESQPRVSKIGIDCRSSVTDLRIRNLAGLEEISGVANLVKLEALYLENTKIPYEQFVQRLGIEDSEQLRFFSFSTGKRVQDRLIDQDIDARFLRPTSEK